VHLGDAQIGLVLAVLDQLEVITDQDAPVLAGGPVPAFERVLDVSSWIET